MSTTLQQCARRVMHTRWNHYLWSGTPVSIAGCRSGNKAQHQSQVVVLPRMRFALSYPMCRPPQVQCPLSSAIPPWQRQATAVTTTTLVRMAVTATVTAMRVSGVVPSSW